MNYWQSNGFLSFKKKPQKPILEILIALMRIFD